MRVGWAVRLYRVGLRALPRALREDSGEEMARTFRGLAERARRRSRLALARLTLVELLDLAAAGIGARLAALPIGGPTARATLRRFVRRPTYALAVIATLALGVGASSAVYAVVRTVVLRPLPFPEPDRLAEVWTDVVADHNPTPGVTNGSFLAWREIDDVFTHIEAFSRDQGVLTDGEPEQVRTAVVTPGLFDLLGLSPVLGRGFRDPEGRPGDTDWALIGWELWVRRYGGDPGVVGSTIELDRRTLTVVGVMPAGLDFPERNTELWLPVAPTPAAMTPAEGAPVVPGVAVLARLRPGLERDEANEILAGRSEELAAAGAAPGTAPWLYPPDLYVTPERTRDTLGLLFGGVLLVLLVAAANVASLGLSQAVDRRPELDVRRALGAGRGRLTLELLVENGALAVVGSALGLALAEAVLDGLTPLLPDQLGIRTWGQSLSAWPGALPFAVVAALAVTLTMTVLTGLRAARGDTRVAVGARTRTDTRGSLRLQQLLVAGQVALAVLLVAGSALVGRSVLRLQAVDTGFDLDRLLVVSIRLPTDLMLGDGEPPSRALFDQRFDAYRTALEGLPGVRSVASSTSPLPLTRARFRPVLESGDGSVADVGQFLPMSEVDPDFFETAGIRILEGRPFPATAGPDEVIVLNDELARRLWPAGGAVGRTVRLTEDAPWLTVAAVVESTVQMGLRDPMGEGAEVWVPFDPSRLGVYRSFLVRAEAGIDPAALAGPVRGAVRSVDPLQPIERLMPLRRAYRESIDGERFFAALIGVFALMAATLAACGTYAILTRALARRAKELGIRAALGARPGALLARVGRTALVPALAGVVVGLGAAWPLSRVLEALLYEVEPGDPLSLVLTAAALLAGVALAAVGPARRALRTDVVAQLRAE